MLRVKTWPDPCACKPGTETNGWHEQRCEMCRKVESRIWADMMKRSRQIAKEYAERLRNV